MKIHGTAKGGAESKKDFGVAFAGDTEPPCSDEYRTTNTGTAGGWGSNDDTVWVSKTSATVSEGDKISKIGCNYAATNNQPYGTKFVCYSDDSGSPDAFICMTQSAATSGTGWIEYDVVDDSGDVEAHEITADEAGYLWIGVWSEDNNYIYVETGVTNGIRQMAQTWNASNTAEPDDPYSENAQHGASLTSRAVACIPD